MIDKILQLLYQINAVSLCAFFAVTTISQLIGTLRTILITKKAGFAAYLVVAVDAFVYSFLLKSLAEQTYYTVILYVAGKLLGTYLAEVIENKMALGIYEVDVYVKDHTLQKLVQDKLLSEGFSSTMYIGTIDDATVRWRITAQLLRKDMNKFNQVLASCGIDKPTTVVKEANYVTGNVEKRIS